MKKAARTPESSQSFNLLDRNLNYTSPDISDKLDRLSAWDTVAIYHGAGGPAYDLGYLLRKLAYVDLPNQLFYLKYNYIDNRWLSGYSDYFEAEADTPENAVALVCIRLLKDKVIKKSKRLY